MKVSKVEIFSTLLRSDKDIGDVLVLAEERDVEENLQRFSIGGKNNELGLTAIEGLGRFVGALAHLQKITTIGLFLTVCKIQKLHYRSEYTVNYRNYRISQG